MQRGQQQLRLRLPLHVIIASVAALSASAQEPLNADSATQPSPGHFTLKHQVRYWEFDADNLDRNRGGVRDVQFVTTLLAGITSDMSLKLETPVVVRRRRFDFPNRTEHEEGFRDITAMLKWRFLRKDINPLDTIRMSLLAGVEVRSGDSPFTSDAYNPILGLAYTQISGRHGINADLKWTFTTGGVRDAVLPGMSSADLLQYDFAYLYRIAPVEYTADTPGAWYVMLEMNGLYETNGDHELRLSPGIMYEATTWAFELGTQIPVWQELDDRPEPEFGVTLGLRFSF